MDKNILDYNNLLPIYQSLYGRQLRLNDFDNFSKLPILEKENIKKSFPAQWMSKKLENALVNNEVEFMTTSGTSGDKMQIIRKKDWWHDEYIRSSQHYPLFHDVFIKKKRKAILTTTICSNTFCSRSALKYENRIFDNLLHLNITQDPNQWSRADIVRICNEINKFEPYVLEADPIYLAIFLQAKEKYDISLNLFKSSYILLSYEYCPVLIYNYIKSKFDCPIEQYYGSTELGYLYFRTNISNNYAIFPDLIKVGFSTVDKSKGLYELFISSFKNEYMPFINYRTGDIVKINNDQEEFIHTTPEHVLLEDIPGRVSDISWINGQAVTIEEVDKIMNSIGKKILIYNVSVTYNEIYVRYTPQNKGVFLQKEDKEKCGELLKKLLSKKKYVFIECRYISPQTSGKFKLMEKIS